MDKELDKYYEAQFDLFIQPGWKDFLEDVERLRDALPSILKIKDGEHLKFVQGQLDIIEWVLDRKNLVQAAYTKLTEDSNADLS